MSPDVDPEILPLNSLKFLSLNSRGHSAYRDEKYPPNGHGEIFRAIFDERYPQLKRDSVLYDVDEWDKWGGGGEAGQIREIVKSDKVLRRLKFHVNGSSLECAASRRGRKIARIINADVGSPRQ